MRMWVSKSNATLGKYIKHVQEGLTSTDKIINQILTLLSSINITELQSKNDIVKLIDASIASNRNSGKTDINIIEHDKRNNNKNEYNNENDDIKLSNNPI